MESLVILCQAGFASDAHTSVWLARVMTGHIRATTVCYGKSLVFKLGTKVRPQRARTSVERVTTGHMRCGAAPEAPWKCVQRERDPPHRLQVDQ